MKKVILASTNLAKKQATVKTVNSLGIQADIIPIKVDSNVSKTPSSDEEGIEGALNRIENAKVKNPKADIYIGMEGIITKSKYGTFICGWAVVNDQSINRTAKGCSAKVQLPDMIAKQINSFKELSELVKNEYPSNLINQMDEIGTNGVVTNRQYTRVDEFEDALYCAFGFLYNDANF
jgi:non-canonical (house-cleaning) NTP pyrophosphatase